MEEVSSLYIPNFPRFYVVVRCSQVVVAAAHSSNTRRVVEPSEGDNGGDRSRRGTPMMRRDD